MKFQIREGFVAQIATRIDLGEGKTEVQVNSYFGGQTCDLTAEQAEMHAHKLEPKDKQAEAWLAAKVMPQAPGQALGLSPEAMALVQAMAAETAKAIVAAVQAPAQAPASNA